MTNPNELTKGVRFRSPSKDEGIVTVVCDYGQCPDDPSRTESVHVEGPWAHYFIFFPNNYDIEEFGAEVME